MAKTTSTQESSDAPVVRARNGRGREELVLDDADGGKTIVHEEVVAKIAGTAVREVPGVHDLAPHGPGESLASIVSRHRKDFGVRVEIGTTECAVDVRIVAEYGASIPKIAEQIRENVGASVHAMTGLVVKEVNVAVTDLYFQRAEAPAEAPPEPLADKRQLR